MDNMFSGLKKALVFLFVSSFLAVCCKPAETDIVKPNKVQQDWAEAEVGVMFHFDMQVYVPEYNWREYGSHPDAATFNPVDLDTDQWMEAASRMGAKYAVLVAKHGSGFSLWPTEAHEYSIKNSPWKDGKGDIVADFVASCRKYGIKPAIYCNTNANGYLHTDRGIVAKDGPVTQKEYNAVVAKQLTELWSNYGELFEIWFDGGVLTPKEGGADVLPLVKELQPNAIAFQGPLGHDNLIRWVGNEEGTAPDPCWATADSTTNSDGVKIIEGLHGSPDAPFWCPGESDFTLRKKAAPGYGWMWAEGQDNLLFSVDELMEKYETSVGRNTNMLLGMVIDPSGLIPEADVKRVEEFGKALKERYGTSVAETSGKGKNMALRLPSPTVIDRVIIQENISEGERVLVWHLEGVKADGSVVRLCEGTNIGHKRIARFAPVEVASLRFVADSSKAKPIIRRFAAFESKESPRIVNIINFIRYTEPRSEEITEKVLYETVHSQAEDLRSKDLIGTYLLQYDALIDPSYQALMKEEIARGCEVGAWWEITQPHVEAAGYTWRGRFPWDWHAHVGFSVGYTQAEREHLVDIYMEKFKEIFGFYPKSVGSWFIEAGTLAYLRDKYGIEASCNCRDQVGTDGYTIWGGYWNGGYYPSRQNAYMPAQTREGGIDVPIFRMLGSDPIYQYEAGVGGVVQSVVTLEPVYKRGGGDPDWIDWFFRMFTKEPHLGYNYVQVGQENSFTWNAMEKGFVCQTDRLVKLREAGKVRIETLSETGRWFKERYPVTPPTSVVTTEDNQGNGLKTLWFNSRYYRCNLLWKDNSLKFRDLHVFDENLRSEYLDHPDTLPVFHYETLPLVDGCLWSSADNMAGLRFTAPGFEGGDPEFPADDEGKRQQVIWPSSDGSGRFLLSFAEDCIDISSDGKVGDWCLELSVNPGTELPFTEISGKSVKARYQGIDYGMSVTKGELEDLRTQGGGAVLRIKPSAGKSGGTVTITLPVK